MIERKMTKKKKREMGHMEIWTWLKINKPFECFVCGWNEDDEDDKSIHIASYQSFGASCQSGRITIDGQCLNQLLGNWFFYSHDQFEYVNIQQMMPVFKFRKANGFEVEDCWAEMLVVVMVVKIACEHSMSKWLRMRITMK